jgi:hypothetical protein
MDSGGADGSEGNAIAMAIVDAIIMRRSHVDTHSRLEEYLCSIVLGPQMNLV